MCGHRQIGWLLRLCRGLGLQQVVNPVLQQNTVHLQANQDPLSGQAKAVLGCVPGLQHGVHQRLQRLLFVVTQAGHWQLTCQPHPAQRPRHPGLSAILARLRCGFGQQLAHQPIVLQAVNLKALVVIDPGCLLVKDHPQPVPEKSLGRLAQKMTELRQGQRHTGVWHKRWQGRMPRQSLCRRHCRLLMRCTPLPGIGDQGCSQLKVAAAKGLQRVMGGALLDQRRAPAGAEVIHQLGHQHRGRLQAVVAHTAPAPAQVQQPACGQQRLEHELAVVFAARAVTGTGHAGQAHEVKVRALAAPGVVTVVHAQQANHLKRYGAHGHEGAKSHAAGLEALVEARQLKGIEPGAAGHFKAQVLAKTGLLTGQLPGGQSVFQGLQCLFVSLRFGLEQP